MADMEAKRTRGAVEPLFAALEERETDEPRSSTAPSRPGLFWKLFWASIVFLALLGVVLNQAF